MVNKEEGCSHFSLYPAEADNDGTDGAYGWVCFRALLNFSYKKNRFRGFIDILVELNRDFLQTQNLHFKLFEKRNTVFSQFADNAFWICTWLINLVNSNDDWNVLAAFEWLMKKLIMV